MKLLHSAEHERSDAAAYILSRRPQDVDFAQMAADFDKGEVRLRRLYCFVMGHQKKPDATVKSTLLKALEDKAPGVRWQAALAFAKAGWGDADIVKALAACLNDKNGCVGAAAGEALVDIHAPDVKALLLQRLADVARTRGAVDANGRDNAEAVRDDTPEGRAAALRVLWYREYSNNIPGLEESLIKGLCQERYTSPELEELLVGIALEAKASAKARSAALDGLEDTGCKATAKRLAALLEDKTVISTREDREPWRICHAAARAIARIEGWEDSKNVGEYSRPQERAGLLAHARKWATSMPATMPG
jgi:HEAT repeat protein